MLSSNSKNSTMILFLSGERDFTLRLKIGFFPLCKKTPNKSYLAGLYNERAFHAGFFCNLTKYTVLTHLAVPFKTY